MFNVKDTYMKKLILIGCAATLFSIGSMAQDTTSINDNLRQGVEETEEEAQEAGNEFQRRTEQAGDEIQEETQEAGDEMRQGAEETGDKIQQGVEETGTEIQQGAERTEENIEQEADEAKEKLDQETSPSSQYAPTEKSDTENSVGSTSGSAQQSEIEVLEEKEGPNNQVVYKYQGELYYVDREQKQLVKIEESQLKDAEHKAIISTDPDN
jgi:hypothetical protein